MVDDLTCFERREVLTHAAETIAEYRQVLNFTPTNNLGSGDVVFALYRMAYNIELFGPAAVSEAMLKAVVVIRALRITLDEI
ncbi:hypothetical protein [Pseudaminobacter soli (ex Li et al. 2025)]|uniref:Uncharacterized protein n=1 Tax=Pseudaminobacter soli (ex Li et al. 2025) TaxID=1295366 RepID=A0A2P7S0R8_9HYPH|nr:hypothetical protein [Mesorhizobium soli]PSJ56060.1 hypothetical protein C7I85_25355 [Mesorhizobium soli]